MSGTASAIYDAAVVGAGPACAATAIHLAGAGLRVALLDKAAFPRDKPCAEFLNPACEPLLADLGVLDTLESVNPARLRGFHIYAPNGRMFQADFAGTLDAAGRPIHETGLAAPRLLLDAALVEAARRSRAEVRKRWRLAQLTHEDGAWTLTPAAFGPVIRARLLIAADGVHSTVARRLGPHVPAHMRKVALVAHLRGIGDLAPYGEMHVAGRRYVGLAPLDTNATDCNVAMVVDEARERRKLVGRAKAFLLESLATFPRLRDRLECVTVSRHTLTVSRICVRTRRLSGEGLLLVGDAGGYYDPFTGEGIYRALRRAPLVAGVAIVALRGGTVDAATLARYDALSREAFRGKRTVERIIQAGVQVPPLMNHFAAVLGRKPAMADTVVAVTGDFLPPWAVLRPGYLLRLLV
jgi:menaquinone-9 beta-reductase